MDFQGNVYVADRSNTRVVVLDNHLNYKTAYTNVGRPWALGVSGGRGANPGHQYLFVSNSWPDNAPAASVDFTGEIYKMELDGTILGKFGHPSKECGGFQVVHMMDCRNPDEIIVGEIESWRVQKPVLK